MTRNPTAYHAAIQAAINALAASPQEAAQVKADLTERADYIRTRRDWRAPLDAHLAWGGIVRGLAEATVYAEQIGKGGK